MLKVEALRAVGQGAATPDNSKIDDAAAALTQAHRRLSGLVREMSNAVPARLDSEGLAAALQSALDHDFRDSFDRVEWHADPGAVERARQLPLFASEVIFFAAQEAIRNAAGNVTLLYSAKDTEHNSALVLKEFWEERM